MIRFMTFEMYHGKRNVGSTNIRVHNLLKYWPEAGLYKYGENPDALIFQKVYCQADYKFPAHFENIKILDICDPDWLDSQNIKETVDAVDGVTCPTEALAEFLRQLTDKPVKVIPDRHDTEGIPEPKTHYGEAKSAVWFGYKQNAELLRFAVLTLEKLGLSLTVISNDDPSANRWASKEDFKYTFKKYNPDTIISELRKHDICVLPQGNRPQDRFKSNNKTTLAWLAGLPVATDGDELRTFMNPEVRNIEAKARYKKAMLEYNCKQSVEEMKAFIEELKERRTNP